MDIRNPVYTETGNIDCEIEHPDYGWIPFTASENDIEGHGRAIYAAAAGMDVAPYVPPPPLTPEQVLASLPSVSRVQMLAALVDFEIITEAEAVGWLGGDLPAVVQAAIDGLSEGARLVATLRAKAQTPVDPSDPLVAALAASKDMGPEALVSLFRHAAAL